MSDKVEIVTNLIAVTIARRKKSFIKFVAAGQKNQSLSVLSRYPLYLSSPLENNRIIPHARGNLKTP
ncbi:MAG: hypothetical protein M0R41_10810 [Methylobacter tundripaludum]|nr:hypothetical protein [Methylobacter tundripaludum]